MKNTTATTESESISKINSSNSSLKVLEIHQTNGNVTMTGKEQDLINGDPQKSEMKSENVPNDVNQGEPRAEKFFTESKEKNELSDSSSSLSSLSSSSDEAVESFNTQRGELTCDREVHGEPNEDENSDMKDHEKSQDFNKENVSVLKKMDMITAENEHLKEMLAAANQKNEEHTIEIEEVKRANKELEKSNKELVDDTISELRTQLLNLSQSKDSLQKELENEKEELGKSQLSNEQLQKDNENISLELENQKKAYCEVQEKLELTMRESESKKNESSKSETLFAEELSKAHSETSQRDHEIHELKRKLEELQKELETKESESCHINEMLETAKLKETAHVEEIRKLKKQLDTAEKSLGIEGEKENELESLKIELQDSKFKVDSQEQELSDLKQQLKIAKNEVTRKESEELEVEQLKEELEHAKSKLEKQEQEIAEAADELQIAKTEVDSTGRDETSLGVLMREELVNAKATIRSLNQANSKLEAKLSNAQTIIETGEVENKKSKEEIRALKDKIKWLERRRMTEREQSTPKSSPRSEISLKEDLEKKLQHESLRRSQERIRDLEQKIIQVNEEKQKLKHDYEEAVKALEAVDKVYSVREMALQQYKTDLEEANNTIKQQSTELLQNQMEAKKLQQDQEQAERDLKHQQQLQEDVKDQLTRTKEMAAIYKTEIDEVRKEFQDQMHELQIAQAKARDRGKKIQLLELELKETKETLQISKNVIDEKERNMQSLQQSLQNEKKNCKNLENQLEEMFYLKKKLQLIEDEKARVVDKLRQTEKELEKALETVESSFKKFQRAEQDFEKAMTDLINARKENEDLNEKLEDHKYQIQKLRSIVDTKEADVEQQLLEIIYYRDQMNDLTLQLQELWATYNADRTLGKTGKSSRSRRPHSASVRRAPKAPAYQTPPSKPHTYAHRRVVNKLGEPVINQNYINSTHKPLPTTLPSAQAVQPEASESSPENGNHHVDAEEGHSSQLSPRPPTGTKPRPLSSYGVRTNSPINGEKREDLWMYRDGSSSVNDDIDEQIISFLVNIGDRVLIQSKVVGEELLNVSGVVRFVGKVGKKTSTSPTYVGLKLDQPFSENSGMTGSKQFFNYPPRNGKLIKMPDIYPKMQNFKRVKSATANW